ncbi:MAG: AraC family transcriptional regulator [bacterium]|nr:AraC family transcriptional regulator [bacterium]
MEQLRAYKKQLELVSGYSILTLCDVGTTYEKQEENTEEFVVDRIDYLIETCNKYKKQIRKMNEGTPFIWTDENERTYGGVRLNETTLFVVMWCQRANTTSFYSLLCLIAGRIQGSLYQEKDIVVLDQKCRKLFEQKQMVDINEWLDEEYEQSHHSYADEEKLFQIIIDGDNEGFQKVVDSGFFKHAGITSKNPVTQQRNLCITYIGLVTRAAIKGQVPSKIAYELSDELLMKLDAMHSAQQIYLFMMQAIHAFINLVQTEKGKRTSNNYIEQCKLYIAKYYKEKIAVGDIADYLGLNSSYLSHIFRKETGITINEYIQQEKIKVAKYLLSNSDFDILTIAHHLSFSSQSYFGSVFRSITGETPQKYRDKNKVRELSEEDVIW